MEASLAPRCRHHAPASGPGRWLTAAITESLLDAWVEAWVEAGVGAGHTYPAQGPYSRIDDVLTSDDVVTRTAAVITTNASDHLPVVADVALPGSKVGNPATGRR